MPQMPSYPPQTPVDDLLASLSQALGQPLAFDEQGQCALETQAGDEVVISHHEAGTCIRVALGVARDDALGRALRWNYESPIPGMKIGLCADSGQLALLAWADVHRPDDLASAVATALAVAAPLHQAMARDDRQPMDAPMHGMRP